MFVAAIWFPLFLFDKILATYHLLGPALFFLSDEAIH